MNREKSGEISETTKKIDLAPEGSLAQVREIFDTLLVQNISCVFREDMSEDKGLGDRIIIGTLAEGTKGPKTGKAEINGKYGTAFIDFALTPDDAEKLYEQLGKAIEDAKSLKDSI